MHTQVLVSSRSRLLRSIAAVLVGLIVNVVLATATDGVMSLVGIFPPLSEYTNPAAHTDVMFVLALAYRAVFGVAGCYVTARLAPERPLLHALLLGAIGFAISVAGGLATQGMSPTWYSLALVATTLPCAWVGGWSYQRRNQSLIA